MAKPVAGGRVKRPIGAQERLDAGLEPLPDLSTADGAAVYLKRLRRLSEAQGRQPVVLGTSAGMIERGETSKAP